MSVGVDEPKRDDAPGVVRPRLAAWLTRPVAVIVGVPVVIYLILSLAGVTNSNIGIATLREDGVVESGDQLGASQTIRSDEYGTESPIWLGELAREGQDARTPLSESNDLFAQLPDGPISTVVFFDGALLGLSSWVSDEILFAAKWWLPTLLLFVGIPLWFKLVSGSYRWGYIAAVLIMCSPTSAWWSGRPVNTIGFVAAGCVLGILGVRAIEDRGRRSIVLGLLAILASGILLARTPTYYQPFAIVVGLPIVIGTAGYLLYRPGARRTKILGLAGIALSGATWTALLFLENLDAVEAGLSTVYPGDRASSGGFISLAQVFGATNLAWLGRLGEGAVVNQTELSSSFSVLLLVLAVLLAVTGWKGSRELRAAFVPIFALAVFWLSWGTVNWGLLGEALPIINRVPDSRAAGAVGFVAIIAFALFMTQWDQRRSLVPGVVAGALAAFISAYAGSDLQMSILPEMRTWMIWVSALVTGLVVFTLVHWPRRWWTVAVVVLSSAALVIQTTPLLVGLGDLRTSGAAQQALRWGDDARESGDLWASDSQAVDSLLTSTAVPSLSARQQIAPDREMWAELDPTGQFEQMWNRGGLHIRFEWQSASDGVEFIQPGADTVIIQGSPCEINQRIPDLRFVVSSTSLESACVEEFSTFSWSGDAFTVYEINGARD